MPRLSGPELVDLCENRYFGNVVRARPDAVLACFTPDTVVVIRHGDNPERRFYGRPAGDAPHVSEFWKHVNDNFAVRVEGFEHVVDVERQRIASTFLVTLAPGPGSPYVGRGTLQLKNCNFFWIEDGLIARMLVYYSNPDTGGDPVGKPSGYPPARSAT